MKPVSRTAFYCAGVRAAGCAQGATGLWRPVRRAVHGRRGLEECSSLSARFTAPNVSNATRHRIIDDLLRDRLADHHDLRVVLIGAGFDSRAFRLKGGRWYEVDEPQVLA